MIFYQFITVQKFITRKSGYTKRKLDGVFCHGIPFSGNISMSVRVTKIIKNGTSVQFCQFTVPKNPTRHTEPKLDDVFCHSMPFSGKRSMSGVAYNYEQPRSWIQVLSPIYTNTQAYLIFLNEYLRNLQEKTKTRENVKNRQKWTRKMDQNSPK